MTCPTPPAEGERRKAVGMARAARRRKPHIARAQARLLTAMLSRDDRTATTDDCVDDLAAEYADGGKWLGSVTSGLAHDGVIRRIGYQPSRRDSRHATPIGVWQAAVSDDELRAWRAALTAMASLPAPSDPLPAPRSTPRPSHQPTLWDVDARLPD